MPAEITDTISGINDIKPAHFDERDKPLVQIQTDVAAYPNLV